MPTLGPASVVECWQSSLSDSDETSSSSHESATSFFDLELLLAPDLVFLSGSMESLEMWDARSADFLEEAISSE